MNIFSSLLLAAALAAPVAAQCNSDLTVTGDGSPGTTLTFDVAGTTADAPTILLVGPNSGSTTIRLPMLNLVLGLGMPMIPISMGTSDANGDASVSIALPPGSYPEVSLFGQAVSISISLPPGRPTLTGCASDVEAFQIGTGN